MKKKPSVLFILDKWCASNPDHGISEWESNIWGSLESTGLAICEKFHFDEYYSLYHEAGDAALVQKCLDYKPDIVCLVIYRFPDSNPNVLTIHTLDIIRHKLKIPMIAIWGDLEIPEQIEISKMILPFVDFNVCTASSAAVSRIAQPLKYLYSWVPKDAIYFYNPGIERDISLCYVGSPKSGRLAAINCLRRNGINAYQGGGERQQHFSTKQYAQIFMRSKIALSFSRAWYSHVTNARAFEVTLCGAMLLEQESFETAKLFTPFIDYVPFYSRKDLVEKAKYYLAHDDERRAIADNGCRRSHEKYSATNFWRIALNKALNPEKSEQGFNENILKLTPERLSKLPLSHSLKLRLLNYSYSNFVIIHNISIIQYLIISKFALWWRASIYFLRLLSKTRFIETILKHSLKHSPKWFLRMLIKITGKLKLSKFRRLIIEIS